MLEREVSSDEQYIVNGIKFLKEQKISAYALCKATETTPHPVSYPTIKKIFSNERAPVRHDAFLGVLEAIQFIIKNLEKIKKQIKVKKNDNDS